MNDYNDESEYRNKLNGDDERIDVINKLKEAQWLELENTADLDFSVERFQELLGSSMCQVTGECDGCGRCDWAEWENYGK